MEVGRARHSLLPVLWYMYTRHPAAVVQFINPRLTGSRGWAALWKGLGSAGVGSRVSRPALAKDRLKQVLDARLLENLLRICLFHSTGDGISQFRFFRAVSCHFAED